MTTTGAESTNTPQTQPTPEPQVVTPVLAVNSGEIKNAIIEHIINRREDIQVTANASINVTVNSWLDEEHIDTFLRHHVSTRPHLREITGVFPVYNEDEIIKVARDIVDNKIKSRPNEFPTLTYADTPVLAPSSLAGINEINRRNQIDQNRANEAIKILIANKITKEGLFQRYLEAITEVGQLGNSHRTQLPFTECQQGIITFRKNSHYTVLVFHCQENPKQVKNIFYDSLGADIPLHFKNALVHFFRAKGYTQTYECISRRDQTEEQLVNCAIFAAFKGIDILNRNLNHLEPSLLNGLENNYAQTMDYSRRLIVEALRTCGHTITMNPEVMAKLQKPESNQLKPRIICLIEVFEQTLNQLKGAKIVHSANETESIPALLLKCIRLCQEIEKEIEQRNKKENKSAEEKQIIEYLQEIRFAFNTLKVKANGVLKEKINPINKEESKTLQNSNAKLKAYFDALLRWVKRLTWKRALLCIGIISLIVLFGAPYFTALTMLPGASIFLIFGGAAAFYAGVSNVKRISRLIKNHFPESFYSEPAPAIIREEQPVLVDETINKYSFPGFNSHIKTEEIKEEETSENNQAQNNLNSRTQPAV